MGQPSTAWRGGRENGGGRKKKELVQFLLRIYNGPHVANFTAKFRLQCMKCLLLPLCRPLRITYEEPSHLLYLFLASFAFFQCERAKNPVIFRYTFTFFVKYPACLRLFGFVCLLFLIGLLFFLRPLF